jgi:hypothetical protein
MIRPNRDPKEDQPGKDKPESNDPEGGSHE